MINVNTYKNLGNLDRVLETEEAVAMSAECRQLASEFESLDLDTPEWLERATVLIRDEISVRTRAADMAKLAEIDRELAGYMSTGERKASALARQTKLRNKLNLTTSKASK